MFENSLTITLKLVSIGNFLMCNLYVWGTMIFFQLWSSGKGKGIGSTQEVTHRSFIDYRLSIIDIDFPMLYSKDNWFQHLFCCQIKSLYFHHAVTHPMSRIQLFHCCSCIERDLQIQQLLHLLAQTFLHACTFFQNCPCSQGVSCHNQCTPSSYDSCSLAPGI